MKFGIAHHEGHEDREGGRQGQGKARDGAGGWPTFFVFLVRFVVDESCLGAVALEGLKTSGVGAERYGNGKIMAGVGEAFLCGLRGAG